MVSQDLLPGPRGCLWLCPGFQAQVLPCSSESLFTHVWPLGLLGEVNSSIGFQEEPLKPAEFIRNKCPVPQPKVSPVVVASLKHCRISMPLLISSGLEYSTVHLDLSILQMAFPTFVLPSCPREEFVCSLLNPGALRPVF